MVLKGLGSCPKAQRCPPSFACDRGVCVGGFGCSSSARGQLRFQEIQRGGDSLTAELHFSFPKKKPPQTQSRALPRPRASRARGAAAAAGSS